MPIGQWVHENRTRLGLTQTQLADATRDAPFDGGIVSAETISAIERGKRTTLTTLKRRGLERVFGVQYPHLVDDTPTASVKDSESGAPDRTADYWLSRLTAAVHRHEREGY